MSRIISISSDEDSGSSTDVEKSPKRAKLDTQADINIIVLDDDDQNVQPKTPPCDKITNGIEPSISLDSDIEDQDENLPGTSKDTKDVTDNGNDRSDDENKTDLANDEINLFEDCEEMQTFIDLCYSHISSEEVKDIFKSKLPLCKKLFEKVGKEFIQSDGFKNELKEKISISRGNPFLALQSFNELFLSLKVQSKGKSDNAGEKKTELVIKKLEHALRKIGKRIRILEDAEIDWDDDGESTFIKQARYKERAVQIHNKLCKYLNVDPHYNQLLHNRLDFSGSDVPEINKAINRKFKNNSVFPTYLDMEKCLRKCVEVNNLQMTDAQFQSEARQCFEKLGNLLQHRRKLDLMTIHSQYLVTNVDPAADNNELNSVLVANYKEGQAKIDEICKKYTILQDSRKDVESPPESDRTDTSESEGEAEKS